MENFHEGGTIHWRDVEEQITVPSRSDELLMELFGIANVTPNAELLSSASLVDMGVLVSKPLWVSSHKLKVNDFIHLTASEFVSQHTVYVP